jgi:aminoglycoside/choline kinase family phosphotransferase
MTSADSQSSPDSTLAAAVALGWAEPARGQALAAWLQRLSAEQGLVPASIVSASADASFRRYFRVSTVDGGSRVIMDAPPQHENCQPFVTVAQLFQQAGVRVPQVLAWDQAQGFMLLTDLGRKTLLTVLDPEQPALALPYFQDALSTLLSWQAASRPGVLPAYDQALLQRELQLFPDWYLVQHKGLVLDGATRDMLAQTFALLVQRNLAAPQVFVHRDYMPRNLMLPQAGFDPIDPNRRLGVLDFQDAVFGPITYDIASLMRDAFLTWEEDMVLDVTIRYWEQARKAGLLDFDGWSDDFGAFYRAVEWMGLQRHLKVAGIFARLTLRDKKPSYLADAPRFLHYIRATALRYRELKPLLRFIDKVEGWEAASGFAYGRV